MRKYVRCCVVDCYVIIYSCFSVVKKLSDYPESLTFVLSLQTLFFYHSGQMIEKAFRNSKTCCFSHSILFNSFFRLPEKSYSNLIFIRHPIIWLVEATCSVQYNAKPTWVVPVSGQTNLFIMPESHFGLANFYPINLSRFYITVRVPLTLLITYP